MNVSVAIVAYNEEKSLPILLENICRQDYPHEKIEILLIDSMSSDKTRSIMEDFQSQNCGFARVLILENPGKLIPCGHNVALKYYSGEALVRVDAHVSLPDDFISKSVKGLMEGENVYGGIVESVADGDSPLAQTLLIAENSVFCGGAASFRHLTEKRYVDTIAFALYRRNVFEKVGYYNPLLPRSEDNDMNYRIREAGYRLCCDPTIRSLRFSRSTFGKLLKQKYMNGYWIGKTLGVSPKCFSIYHFVPFAFVLGIFFTTFLLILGYSFFSVLMWVAYAVVTLGVSFMEIKKRKFSMTNLLLPLLFLLLHVSYGFGTFVGLIEMPFWVRKAKSKSVKK